LKSLSTAICVNLPKCDRIFMREETT